MQRSIEIIVRLIQAGQRAYARKWSFLGFFLFAFFGSVIILGTLDLLPEAKARDVSPLVAAEGLDVPAQTDRVELPAKITIPAIGLMAAVVNPTTTAIAALDQELLKGAVRYPTSAKLGEAGNMILFGHSSYLPVVGNQAYKTFNDIQKLHAGDTIIVSSSDVAYTYRVRTVEKMNATDGAIPLNVTGRVLTLSTCDSFGKKTDRFVVTADFVESRPAS
ncbi:hypothetical protein A3J11_01105 [Candidatus Kaiserbacteria bacterium RIFCSPLOWO2_02_FULL_55_12]|uniref:Sortase n=2 Tax=Candidatus Kaiseribacteriota TaxID=1752734 RepID=A0A1F6F002_9BACT|nr:MAG: hypothetical protein A3C94_01605 [Candidatus Kaiserbacteria bacterium RIFCSPHIGHO2_02_FULL_55_17]OGG79194.1 MAG: hypothetical protein A3J11_01105 [Candidatus Kaiserbacteria bacterium RIFCSPLOWO2_02_FULL_55_12]